VDRAFEPVNKINLMARTSHDIAARAFEKISGC